MKYLFHSGRRTHQHLAHLASGQIQAVHYRLTCLGAMAISTGIQLVVVTVVHNVSMQMQMILDRIGPSGITMCSSSLKIIKKSG